MSNKSIGWGVLALMALLTLFANVSLLPAPVSAVAPLQASTAIAQPTAQPAVPPRRSTREPPPPEIQAGLRATMQRAAAFALPATLIVLAAIIVLHRARGRRGRGSLS